jgi:hypothetical protein
MAELKTIEGEIVSIDPEKRFFTLADRQGIIFAKVLYGPQFDQRIAKQKVGYYEKVPVEMSDESPDAVLVDIQYTPRPADFPHLQPRKGSGGSKGNYQQRNEALIAYETVYKANAENVRAMLPMVELLGNQDESDVVIFKRVYNAIMDVALERTKKDAKALIEASRE